MAELRGRDHRLLVEALYSYGGDREDRLTEVLASVLEVAPALCTRLAEKLGYNGKAQRFTVQTQVGAPAQRRLVDLVLTAWDGDGHPDVTIFVECKYNPTCKDDPYWFSVKQATRQQAVLDQQPGRGILAGLCSEDDLQRSQRPTGARADLFNPRDAYETVISWKDVKSIAQQCVDIGTSKDSPGDIPTPLAQRAVAELLSYLNLEGDPVGALSDDDLFGLAHYAQTDDRIQRLLWQASEVLTQSMAEGSATPLEFGLDDDVDSTTQAQRRWVASDAPEATWLHPLRESAVFIMLTGAEYDSDSEVGIPTAYAGAGWNAGRETKKLLAGSPFERAANEAGLSLHWEGTVCNLLADRPLQQITDAGNSIADQGDRLGTWAHQSLTALLALPAPANADTNNIKPTRGRR